VSGGSLDGRLRYESVLFRYVGDRDRPLSVSFR
jgi:hypothetical protein